jgi:hypothetical protein
MKSGCFGNMMLTFHMNTHRANAHIFCVGFLSFFVASVLMEEKSVFQNSDVYFSTTGWLNLVLNKLRFTNV